MLPAAIVVHRMPGRVRVRVDDHRRDEAYFARVVKQLRECPTVVDVAATPVTGSILIQHEGTDTDTIRSHARAFDLFEMMTPSDRIDAAGPPPDRVVRAGLFRVDQWMRREGGNGAQLRSVALVGLLGAAVWQALRGHVLPASATLVWYALLLSGRSGPKGGHPELDVATAAKDAGDAHW